jgi:hypothetical protein
MRFKQFNETSNILINGLLDNDGKLQLNQTNQQSYSTQGTYTCAHQ